VHLALMRMLSRDPELEGAGTGDRRWLVADQLGSVVAVTNASGVASNLNGAPGASNTGRFGYTGQAWLPEAQLYHYKARAYVPALGRFLQTDPRAIAKRSSMALAPPADKAVKFGHELEVSPVRASKRLRRGTW
jgi:RHS repeat-associated protein